ncbi:MAG TPA: ABC transporter substrate-binding protein [Geminicoccaceae bacterium]|jgi:NitT/TauT family transport system substrate-binding protein|nr:ABC transporter substrate-binding protein [Geminicoccaceae bacterium]
MRSISKRLAVALSFASVLAWSGAWSQDAHAAVGDPDTVTCAYPVWVGFGPVHLANELGYFKDEGITVEEILDDDMPNAVAAMERGDIDCYLRTVGEYQGLGRRKDTQGIIIGTIDLSTGGDGWAADQSIQSVCDLEGKTIAVEPNLPARLLLQEALRRECDLSIADTNLTDIAAADAIGVFSSPDVAAVGTYEPVLSQVVATHTGRGAHILLSSKDYEDLILDIIMAHTDELAANPDKYVKFLRGIYRAIDYFYANQEEAIPVIASFFSITPEEFKETLPNFRYTPLDEAKGFIGTAEAPGRAYEIFRDTMELNLEFGSSDVELFPEDHITTEIISQVEKDWE